MNEDQLLAVDTILHAVAFIVAVGYGFRNRRLAAAGLACLSPVVFMWLFFEGPGEHIDGFPTARTALVAYVIANALLVWGLYLVGSPKDGEASDDEAGPRRRRFLAGSFSGYLVLVSLWAAVGLIWA